LPEAVHHHHHPALAHHFDDLGQQAEAATLGMWVFLVTEVLFFGGLFCCYLVYRSAYPLAFAFGSHELDITLGTINTAVLITSSLTMALAVHAAQLGQQRVLTLFLLATMALGATFLVIKGVEYYHKFEECPTLVAELHLPGGHAGGGEAAPAGCHVPGPEFSFEPAAQAKPAQIFFSLYFIMTGLHAIHMIIGLGIMTWMVWWSTRGLITADYYSPIEVSGLYWHFVDIVWIFLFPLLYLIGRHGT
jgi:cytochrome c oxidase subunit 3